ncbi:hypothetical protein WICMUC_002749 [Wickerhamomyces mucosus]|uniref:Uncharacterized protein n=1 Tax=Wickerhamomyces mucosus TaxID=1378264 RepID=A0A9P8PPS3_9ASCO|nr:hypothetical protein WICMUC_002749 [Wickerhamomyces mucosus]
MQILYFYQCHLGSRRSLVIVVTVGVVLVNEAVNEAVIVVAVVDFVVVAVVVVVVIVFDAAIVNSAVGLELGVVGCYLDLGSLIENLVSD